MDLKVSELARTADGKTSTYVSTGKKIGEEAVEAVMAAKDAEHGGDPQRLVAEVADLWFHSMIALAHYGLGPADVVAELVRREGTSGIEEKALRKVRAREAGGT